MAIKAGVGVAASFEGKVPDTGIPPNGYTLPAKKGVAYMALATGAEVVPVALVGTERVRHPSKRFWQWGWRERYVIVFGKPIAPPKLDHEPTSQDRDDFTAKYVAVVHDLIDVGNRELARA
jgi:1-acyl-sn-glycerol-3-phosphate acyltransferase